MTVVPTAALTCAMVRKGEGVGGAGGESSGGGEEDDYSESQRECAMAYDYKNWGLIVPRDRRRV